jgi:hypothetical protein
MVMLLTSACSYNQVCHQVRNKLVIKLSFPLQTYPSIMRLWECCAHHFLGMLP